MGQVYYQIFFWYLCYVRGPFFLLFCMLGAINVIFVCFASVMVTCIVFARGTTMFGERCEVGLIVFAGKNFTSGFGTIFTWGFSRGFDQNNKLWGVNWIFIFYVVAAPSGTQCGLATSAHGGGNVGFVAASFKGPITGTGNSVVNVGLFGVTFYGNGELLIWIANCSAYNGVVGPWVCQWVPIIYAGVADPYAI